jgi:pimeloyl-ACP methyl ester carboxylesterase
VSRTFLSSPAWSLVAALALGLAAFSGLLTARAMPHGPATATQAMIVLLAGLVVGLIAGLAMRSRWALLLAPLVYVLTVELTRRGIAGPTAGAIRLDETFGILALILGRGFHGLVGLLPMILAAELGVRLARNLAGQPAWPNSLLGWVPAALAGLALIALAVAILWPARTPPILGADGKPLPGSIAEVTRVRIGGQDQGITIRGQSVEKPVLLYLAGGPGQSSLPHPRVIFEELEKDFIIVAWDQRGTGKSYAALDPTAGLTPQRAVADAIELTDYLRKRFAEDKIYLIGESYGTILGVLTIQQRPDLYHAFIGSGQMVNVAETDRRIYRDLLANAEQTGDARLAAKLRGFGEPPYADIPYANGFVMTNYDRLYKPYMPAQSYIERGTRSGMDQFGLKGSEYNLVEKVNVLRGLIDMFSVMYPQLQAVDLRRDAAKLTVPVYVLDGQAELAARRDLALEWFNLLDAPQKRLFSFENAAHAVAFEEYEAFHRILVETILPETYGK